MSTVEENELRRSLALFLRWSALLALSALLGGGSAYLTTARQPPIYRATTLLVVEQLGVGQGSYSDVLASNQSVTTYVALIAQPVVLDQAASEVPGTSAKDLANRVHASSETGTSVIQLQVDDTSPTRAALLADAIAATFISVRHASAQTAFDGAQQELARQIEDMKSQQNSLTDQISSLQAANPSSPRLPTLRQQLSALVSRQIAQENVSSQLAQQYVITSNNIRVFQPAVPPTEPDHPKPLLYGVIGGLLALALSVGVMLLGGSAPQAAVRPMIAFRWWGRQTRRAEPGEPPEGVVDRRSA